MRKILADAGGYFLDMIFPVYCLGCGINREDLPAPRRWICPECLEKINLRKEQSCPACEKESEGGKTHYSCRNMIFLDGLWASAYYSESELVEKAVHGLKFDFFREISQPLAGIMSKSIMEAEEFGDFQDMILSSFSKENEEDIYEDEEKNGKTAAVLVPVPLHKKRYNWRGFNQSSLLAGHIGGKFNIPVCEDILARVKNTKPQSQTSGSEERRINISDAFYCISPARAKGKNIILVDDICTTCATLNECAKELKAAGAKNVWGLVVARR